MNRCHIALLGLVYFFIVPLCSHAQDVPLGVQPSPLVRLFGALEVVDQLRPSSYPVLSVWVGDKPRVFRVAQVQSVIPAYRAEERIREVSSLGLRFLADGDVLTALQNPAMHDRPIVIEGWLRPSAGVLRVRSVKVAEELQDSP